MHFIKSISIFSILTISLFSDLNRTIQAELFAIDKSIEKISHSLSPNSSIWLKSYSNYNLYLQIVERLKMVKGKIEDGGETRTLLNSKEILNKQLQLFGDMSSPFEKLLQPPQHEEVQRVTNPFDIFSSLSHINQNIQHMNDYHKRVEDVSIILEKMKKRFALLSRKDELSPINEVEKREVEGYRVEMELFEEALSTLETTSEIYKKKIDEVNFEIEREILNHSKTIFTLFTIFVILIILAFALKYLSGRYFEDNQRVYMTNKAINFITITIMVVVLTFTYIDNINYLITILGFASAGLAIAMKDGFMSVFAWFVIIFGGSVKVGDRIKVVMNGAEYVGDILDISLLRITLQEDVTLTTYDVNRRAGRIIFVPNNYIFTNLVANYSHYTLRTVWDGIDIIITFDSNHKKASHIMKEIAKNYSSGYTDMTRKQLNKLRDRYNLRNTNVEPRMFSFIDQYGIKLSVWYLTNAYATLTLRSNISTKIIDSFNAEDDIKIAYPTQEINLNRS